MLPTSKLIFEEKIWKFAKRFLTFALRMNGLKNTEFVSKKVSKINLEV